MLSGLEQARSKDGKGRGKPCSSPGLPSDLRPGKWCAQLPGSLYLPCAWHSARSRDLGLGVYRGSRGSSCVDASTLRCPAQEIRQLSGQGLATRHFPINGWCAPVLSTGSDEWCAGRCGSH